MRPRARRIGAAVVLVLTLIGWPLSALTFARHEPQFILGLSWLAMTLTATDILCTTDVRAQGEDQ